MQNPINPSKRFFKLTSFRLVTDSVLVGQSNEETLLFGPGGMIVGFAALTTPRPLDIGLQLELSDWTPVIMTHISRLNNLHCTSIRQLLRQERGQVRPNSATHSGFRRLEPSPASLVELMGEADLGRQQPRGLVQVIFTSAQAQPLTIETGPIEEMLLNWYAQTVQPCRRDLGHIGYILQHRGADLTDTSRQRLRERLQIYDLILRDEVAKIRGNSAQTLQLEVRAYHELFQVAELIKRCR